MNKTKRIALSAAVCALLAWASYRLMHPNAGRTAATPATADSKTSGEAPPTPAHEMAALQEELKKKPKHLPILMRLSELESQAGQKDKAIGHLREAVESEPDNLDTRLELGRALFEAGKVDDAIKETKLILDKNPKHVDALYNLGAIHANIHQEKEAREYWKRASEAGPGTPSGKNAVASIAKLDGQFTDPHAGRAMPANHPKPTGW